MADMSDKKLDIEHTSSNEDRAQNLESGRADHVLGAAKLDDARSRGLQPPAFIANLSPEERVAFERRLVKKIDLRLMPMVILMYILNYIDRSVKTSLPSVRNVLTGERNNIAAAKLAGLPEDLNLHADSGEFQTAVSILFVGYLLMQIPSNLFLNKIGKPAIYLPTCMIIWGVISAATAAVTNFGGLLAIRFFLGFLVLIFGIVASGSVTNFFPAVVRTLGYNDVQSLLLTTPPYVLCVITTAVNAWHADRSGERYWHVTLPLWVAVAAFIIAATVPSTTFAARYIAMMLMNLHLTSPGGPWRIYRRPPAKRAAGLAFINAVSNASSIYASYMYLDWMAPNYVIAMSVNCCTSFMAIVAATVLRFMLVRLNKKLDQGIYVEGAINALPGEAAQHGFRFKI
ncbi:hypothetical protein DL768_001251 [Monosporascus sp. mg162]|nr:hypothetical protein DL768_001251 [Monosporascus sp. mg162]